MSDIKYLNSRANWLEKEKYRLQKELLKIEKELAQIHSLIQKERRKCDENHENENKTKTAEKSNNK